MTRLGYYPKLFLFIANLSREVLISGLDEQWHDNLNKEIK